MPGSAANGSFVLSTKYPGGASAVAGPADAAVTAASNTVKTASKRAARLMASLPSDRRVNPHVCESRAAMTLLSVAGTGGATPSSSIRNLVPDLGRLRAGWPTCSSAHALRLVVPGENTAKEGGDAMPSLNQQLAPQDSGSHTTRWIVIAV